MQVNNSIRKINYNKKFIIIGILIVLSTLLLSVIFYDQSLEFFTTNWGIGEPFGTLSYSFIIIFIVWPPIQIAIFWAFAFLDATIENQKFIFDIDTPGLLVYLFKNKTLSDKQTYHPFLVKSILPLGVISMLNIMYIQLASVRGVESIGFINIIIQIFSIIIFGISLWIYTSKR